MAYPTRHIYYSSGGTPNSLTDDPYIRWLRYLLAEPTSRRQSAHRMAASNRTWRRTMCGALAPYLRSLERGASASSSRAVMTASARGTAWSRTAPEKSIPSSSPSSPQLVCVAFFFCLQAVHGRKYESLTTPPRFL